LPIIARLTGRKDQLDIAESAAKAILESPNALPFEIVAVRNGLAIMSVIMNDAAGAGAQYEALEPLRGTMPKYVFEPSIDRVLGLLCATMGDLGNAVIHFEEAQAFSRGAGYLPELAWSCYDHANCLLRLGTAEHKPNAGMLLEKAAVIAEDLGMRPLIENIASLNESLAPSFAAKADYPQGLSPREIDVLRLVACGRTDREIAEELFISVKTVGFHVGNILNKTNCVNRTEAATFAAQHDLIP
jgi:DNA-binding CsgD family transcriptional regulator